MTSSEDEGIEQIEDINLHSYFIQLFDSIEAIIDSKDEIQQKTSTINDILSNADLPYINKRPINEFLNGLESLRKKSKLSGFLEIFQRSRIKNKKMLNIIIKAFLIQLNILSNNKKENNSLIMFKFIIANTIFILNKKDIKKLIHFLNEKITTNPDYVKSIIEMVEKTKNIYTIFICGLTLSTQNEKITNENKEKLSSFLASYFEDKILDDDERDKNIVIERLFSQFLPFLTSKFLYETIFQKCQSLLYRSSQNGVFLHTIFTTMNKINPKFFYEDEFVNKMFETFKDFFFPSNNDNFDICVKSFAQVIHNCSDIKK